MCEVVNESFAQQTVQTHNSCSMQLLYVAIGKKLDAL